MIVFKVVSSVLVALVAVVATARPSAASTILLDECNSAALCGQVRVTTTLVGNAIDVDVTDVLGLPPFGIFGSNGGNRAFAFNVVDPDAGVTVSNISAGFSYAGANINLAGPFGDFEFLLNGPGTGNGAILPLHFRVTRTLGFTSDLQLFEANEAGYFFAAHVRNNETGLTGWAAAAAGDDRQVSAVPEPGSMVLLGSGVLALAARGLRRRR
jgi:hypothetical protein